MGEWATNWETSEGKGKILKPALNDLYYALVERLSVTGSAGFDLLPVETGDILPNPYNDGFGWFEDFQLWIDGLITQFINHTDNGGEWDGIADIPNWTEATIIAEIGDAERYQFPVDPLISAKWLYQQYNILNLLRWTTNEFATLFTDVENREGGSGLGTPANAMWTIADNNWTADAYGAHGSPIEVRSDMGRHVSSDYQAYLETIRGKYTKTFTVDAYASIDIYSYASLKTYSYGPLVPTYTFATETGWTENTYVKHDSIAEQDLSSATVTSSLITPNKPNQPATPTADNTVEVRSAQLGDGVYVTKFDGANGFTYENWS